MMKTHNIKLDIHFCDDVLNGRKNFEVRKNDRGYQAGDLVKFIPVDGYFHENHDVQKHTYEITYVLSGWGPKEGYVVFGIKPYQGR